jgi:hypothetical protein
MRRDSSRDAAAQQKQCHSLLISEKEKAEGTSLTLIVVKIFRSQNRGN